MTQEIPAPEMHAKQVLSVFDFDGTLTRHDSFVPFLKFAFGRREFSRRVLMLAIPSIRFLTRRMTRDELKAQLVSTFLTGVESEWVSKQAESFCSVYWLQLMRPSGLESIAAEITAGSQVTLCSASPALVLQPFAARLGVKLIGTELEVIDGLLTGRIAGNNCRCENKVLRLEAVYGPLSQYRLKAWGDTRGDHELLAAAQEPHWRHFHPAWRRGRLRGVKGRNAGVSDVALTQRQVAVKPGRDVNTDDQQGA